MRSLHKVFVSTQHIALTISVVYIAFVHGMKLIALMLAILFVVSIISSSLYVSNVFKNKTYDDEIKKVIENEPKN